MAFFLLCLIMRVTGCAILIALIMALSMNVNGQENQISSDIIWDTDRSHSGTITVSKGFSLTVENSVVNMEAGSRIVVEEGATLIISESEITTSNPPQGIVGFGHGIGSSASSFMIPASDYDGSFRASISPFEGGSFFGFEFIVNDDESIYGNESELVLEFDSDASDTWITVLGFPTSSVGIAGLELEFDDSNTIQIPGIDLETRNMRPYGTAGYEILSSGSVHISGSTILGGDLQLDGNTIISHTALNRSTPIMAMSNAANMSLSNVSIGWSMDDHDLRMGPSTTLSAISVDWTGGLTDRWERRVGQQMVEFSSSDVVYRVDGLGYQQSNMGSLISDQNGLGLVGSGIERVVEIGWALDSEQYSQSPIWAEEAFIITESFRTAWNPQSEVQDYGGRVAVDWNKSTIIAKAGSPDIVSWETPDILILSIDYGENLDADPNEGWRANLTISNTGSADAIVYFVCDEAQTGLRQSIGDAYVGGLVEAGDTSMFPINWTPAGEGEMALACTILTPSQLVNEDHWGGGSITTPLIDFQYTEENGAGSVVPALVAMAGVGILIGVFLIKRSYST